MGEQHSQHLPQPPYSSPNSLPLWKKKRAQAQRGPLMYKAQQGDPDAQRRLPLVFFPHTIPRAASSWFSCTTSPDTRSGHHILWNATISSILPQVYSCRVSFESYTIILSRTGVWNETNREVVDISEMEMTFPNLQLFFSLFLILFQPSEPLLLSLWN